MTRRKLMYDLNRFWVLRFFTGFFTSSTYGVTYTYVLELLTEQRRMLLGIINAITFGVGTMYFSLLAWVFRDWRQLARAVALSPGDTAFYAIISYFFFSDTSYYRFLHLGRISSMVTVTEKGRWSAQSVESNCKNEQVRLSRHDGWWNASWGERGQ